MSESRQPTMPRRIRLAFRLAYAVAPAADQAWLEEMRLEWAFLPRSERAGWVWGTLVTALRFRVAASKPAWSAPRTFVLTSATVAALIAVIVLVPTATLPIERTDTRQEAQAGDPPAQPSSAPIQEPTTSPEGLSFAERAQDAAPMVQADAASGVEDEAAAPVPSLPAPPMNESFADSVEESDDLTKLEAAATDSEARVAASNPEGQSLGAAPSAREGAASRPPGSLRLEPGAVIVLTGEQATVEVLRTTRLELLELRSDPPAPINRQVLAGERLSVRLPFVIKAEDAGAVYLSIDGQPLGLLGPSGLPLARKFLQP